MPPVTPCQVPQDLHIHTVFSNGDGAVVPEQTLELIARVRHARILGISDHADLIVRHGSYETYAAQVRARGFHLGLELTNHDQIPDALAMNPEYFVYHCPNTPESYRGAERLLTTGKPVIIAHPQICGTDLDRVCPECLIEINNRYIWQRDWRELAPFARRFRFVINSDAHQPLWLGQHVARAAAAELGIHEHLVFPAPDAVSPRA